MFFSNICYLFIFSFIFNCIICVKHDPNNFLICNQINCPLDRGRCTRDNKCVCNEDYISITNNLVLDEKGNAYSDDIKVIDNHQCNYELTERSKILLLEFVIGFGLGHLFLGHYIIGIIKFILFFSTIILLSVKPCMEINNKNSKNILKISIITGIIYIIWNCIDAYLIVEGKYKDKYGLEMKSSW